MGKDELKPVLFAKALIMTISVGTSFSRKFVFNDADSQTNM